MKTLFLLAAVALMLGMVRDARAAKPLPTKPQPEKPALSPEVVAGNNQFALDLYRQLDASCQTRRSAVLFPLQHFHGDGDGVCRGARRDGRADGEDAALHAAS